MRFTARARLETWAHASRAQSEDETYGMLEHLADRAGDSAGRGNRPGADGAGSADVVAVEHAARSGRMEMSAWAGPSVHEPRELPEPRELTEPAAWRVYFPDEQREELASSLDELCDDLTNCAHDEPEPL